MFWLEVDQCFWIITGCDVMSRHGVIIILIEWVQLHEIGKSCPWVRSAKLAGLVLGLVLDMISSYKYRYIIWCIIDVSNISIWSKYHRFNYPKTSSHLKIHHWICQSRQFGERIQTPISGFMGVRNHGCPESHSQPIPRGLKKGRRQSFAHLLGTRATNKIH